MPSGWTEGVLNRGKGGDIPSGEREGTHPVGQGRGHAYRNDCSSNSHTSQAALRSNSSRISFLIHTSIYYGTHKHTAPYLSSLNCTHICSVGIGLVPKRLEPNQQHYYGVSELNGEWCLHYYIKVVCTVKLNNIFIIVAMCTWGADRPYSTTLGGLIGLIVPPWWVGGGGGGADLC